MKDRGVDLTKGHRIHVESWVVSPHDALSSDSADVRKGYGPREVHTSIFRINYLLPEGSAGSTREYTLPSARQTPRQALRPRSVTSPHPRQQAQSVPAVPAIKHLPPNRHAPLTSLPDPDSPTVPITVSRPTSIHKTTASDLAKSKAPALRRTKSSVSNAVEPTTSKTASTSRPPIPIPSRSKGNASPTSSFAKLLISAREGSRIVDSPIGSAEDVHPPGRGLTEEQEALTTGAAPSTSPTMMQLPFAEPTAQVGISWTGSRPYGTNPSPSRLVPTHGASPDTADGDWINYFPVDRNMVGKVKKPHGRAFCGGYSDVYKCEVRFETYAATNPKIVAVKMLRPVGLEACNEAEALERMIEENILVDDNGDALIMDFGLATVMEANPWYSSSHRQGGSVRWMAPELLFDITATRSCSTDVYSYGGVAFEVMTSDPPHSGLPDAKIPLAIGLAENPKSPCDDWSKYPQLPNEMKDMIVKCWSRSQRRPTMESIEEGLGRMLHMRVED
ncbi:hypothetical protein FRC00_010648 [Tulasnella sp. 408]|nr:hypothetical protein FRC00_010648 [Tulasnella sp. 408]